MNREGGVCVSLLTAEDARCWAYQVPNLLRREFVRQPDAARQVDIGPIADGKVFRVIGIGVGGILALSTFFKCVPGKWKWVTAAGAAASSAAGLLYGREAGRCMAAVREAVPSIKKAIMSYADAIEADAELRDNLARHLASTVTVQDVSFRPLEFAIMGKAIDFGRINGNFDSLTRSPKTSSEERRRIDPTFRSTLERG